MSSDLRRIPGARVPRRSPVRAVRADPVTAAPRHRPTVLRDPRAGLGRPPKRMMSARPRRLGALDLAMVVLGLGLTAFIARWAWEGTRVDVTMRGLEPRASMTSAALHQLAVDFSVDPTASIDRAELTLDGEEIDDDQLERVGDTVVWRPAEVLEGEHRLALSVPRVALGDSRFEWRFTVDDTPPAVSVPTPMPAAGVCEAVSVSGTAEPDSELTVDGVPVEHRDGRFTLDFDRPPTAPLDVRSVDRAGNETRAEVVFPVRYPGGQGVHVTAAAWGYEPLRRHVLDLVDAGLVSTVELDIKDEGGVVGYDTRVELAHQVGAVRPEYDLEETVRDLEDRGVRVIGRIVAFRDGPLARWAWANDRRDWVVQDANGGMLSAYGGFTNAANADVRRYNLDLAAEAVDAGVEDILWDYVRRPEGALAGMVFPGLQGTPSDAIVAFLAEGRRMLHERCAYQGASVFGIAADRPDAVAQDIPRIARNVDYVAPMLYPSHWVKGEYGVEYPNAQPYDIITATLADFQEKMAGTGTALVPWIQDFSMGYPYGPEEVRAQIDAAADLGVRSWLLWNPSVRYTTEALDVGLVEFSDPGPPGR